jgi:hypothetical protein
MSRSHHSPFSAQISLLLLVSALASYSAPGEGTKVRGRVSLDVNVTPFSSYDAAFIAAVQQRWYDLLDSSHFPRSSGKVVIDFILTYDGRITDLKVRKNEVGEILALLCQRALLDPTPYARWPDDMRQMIGASKRSASLTFFYDRAPVTIPHSRTDEPRPMFGTVLDNLSHREQEVSLEINMDEKGMRLNLMEWGWKPEVGLMLRPDVRACVLRSSAPVTPAAVGELQAALRKTIEWNRIAITNDLYVEDKRIQLTNSPDVSVSFNRVKGESNFIVRVLIGSQKGKMPYPGNQNSYHGKNNWFATNGDEIEPLISHLTHLLRYAVDQHRLKLASEATAQQEEEERDRIKAEQRRKANELLK